jgi:DNA-binding MarR family transcriptional regulator
MLMKAELLKTISEHFASIVPLLHKKMFRNFPMEKIPLQLTRSNKEVLFSLFEIRRASVTELCNLLHISGPNMTPLIDKLVKFKFLCRKPSEEDRRVVQIEITNEGDLFCKEMKLLLQQQIESNLDSLDDEDLIVLRESLISLKKIIMKIDT